MRNAVVRNGVCFVEAGVIVPAEETDDLRARLGAEEARRLTLEVEKAELQTLVEALRHQAGEREAAFALRDGKIAQILGRLEKKVAGLKRKACRLEARMRTSKRPNPNGASGRAARSEVR